MRYLTVGKVGNQNQIKHQNPRGTCRTAAKAANTKTRKIPTQKVFFGIALIVLIVATYGIWQYYEGQKPPKIQGDTNDSPPMVVAPDFSFRDINGSAISLSQFSGRIIGIHFMSVGCGGQIDPVNQLQLEYLKNLCTSYCSKKSATFITVAVATCANSALDQIRSNYGVTWALGNDYDDSVLDIVESYIPYGIGDGTVVLVDKTFNIAKIYVGGVSTETLSSTIDQLSEA